MRIGLNGAVLEAGQAVIPVTDHGFLYGMGLFETFRTYDGEPHLLDRHLARLHAGCKQLDIRWDMDETAFRAWLADCLAANGLRDAYVRLTLSAGDGGLGLPSVPYDCPTAVLMVKPLPSPDGRLYREGRELCILRTPRNSPETPVRLKSLHYMNNIVAKRELAASGVSANAEGLLLSRDGWLAEGIVSNLFFVKADGVVRTPHIDTGILPGITRARVLELAQEMGMLTEEGLYTVDDLLAAEEIWLTGSVQELVPVTRVTTADGAGQAVGSGMAGSIHAALLAAYRREIGMNE